MGLFGKKNKNIELKQDISGYLVFPYPLKHDVVYLNRKAIVPENALLAFAARGKVLDWLPTGTHTLTPVILPLANKKFKLSKLDKYGDAPDGFNAFAYFVNMGVVQNFVFGTYKKLRFNNAKDGRFWVKLQFAVDLQVVDHEKFLKSLLRQLAILRPNEPEDIVATWLSEFTTEHLQKYQFFKSQFTRPRADEIAEVLQAKLAPLLEDVGLGILGMRVLEIDMAGLKKQPKNPLMAKVPESPKSTKSTNFLQENLKNQEKICHETDIILEENEYSTSLEDNEMTIYKPEEQWQAACAEDYEAIEAQRAKLEEKNALKDKRSVWSGWEKFLGKD